MTGRGKLLQNILNAKVDDSGISSGSRPSAFRRNFGGPPTSNEETSPDEGIADSRSTSIVVSVSSSTRARGRLSKLVAALSVDETPEPAVVAVEKPSTVPKTRGDSGTTINVAVNYVKLLTDPNKGVFEYEVRFNPVIASKGIRYALLMQHKDVVGGARTFDGVTLQLPLKLQDPVTRRVSKNNEGNEYQLEIIYKRQKTLKDSINLFGVLFDKIAKILKMARFRRKQFDPSKPYLIPQYKLEIWPGFISSVDEYEGGVMLCLDISFKFLHTSTVLDLLEEAFRSSDGGDFKTKFEQAILGKVVITRYNNKTFCVHDVLWDQNPESTFETTKGRKISFKDYYDEHWNLKIKDLKQPLLLNHSTRRIAGKDTLEEQQHCLIPSLCYLTDLTDAMRGDFTVMKDVASYTRVAPNQRIGALKKFIENVKNNAEATAALSCWGLKLDDSILNLSARVVESAQIKFRNNTLRIGGREDSEFGSQVARNEIIDAIDFDSWLIVYPKKCQQTANKFINLAKKCAGPMGIRLKPPKIFELNTDSTHAYVMALKENIHNLLQIVVIIVPSQRDDRYAAIKRICCSECPIPSQVINSRTLSDDRKARNVTCKILLQMNCKMGGSLWGINIPMKGAMIIGMDTFHDADKRGQSVAAFVASTDATYSKWFSRAIIQKKKEELSNGLHQSLIASLQKYCAVNGSLPTRIIFFRDGVGDGQLPLIQNYEVPQLERAWRMAFPEYTPEFVFVVVQKRINTRIVLDETYGASNPPSGTIVDHTITRKNMYDFFLVPQKVTQGTVSPTHYIVVHDSANLKANIIQNLAFRLCFQYYNWSGAVKVPAPCQYAHKLAYLVGEHIKRPVADSLGDKLFYL